MQGSFQNASLMRRCFKPDYSALVPQSMAMVNSDTSRTQRHKSAIPLDFSFHFNIMGRPFRAKGSPYLYGASAEPSNRGQGPLSDIHNIHNIHGIHDIPWIVRVPISARLWVQQ